jgi:hypothetical protein
MSRLRILFAWLLIAAVPMQGFAAASMLFCGMGAQHQHTAQASEPHDHVAMHGHSGDAAQGHHAHATDPAPDASADADHTCSICAACCNGMALVGVSHMAAVAPAAQAELAEPFVLIHTLPTPVPDKPPRA